MPHFSSKEMYFRIKPIFLRFLYNILTSIVWQLLKLVALFYPKIKLFVKGRKRSLSVLRKQLEPSDKTIWMHVASLGEYEQGVPVLEVLKTTYPKHKILVTFFSPSGFEVKKNSALADVVCYLPMDTQKNVALFLELTNPIIALFVKYEIWPNYLKALQKRHVPTLLLSAIFSERQAYFKWYGKWLNKSLRAFTHFFVQDERSKQLLQSIGYTNCTISGDTRFDRVRKILKQDNTLDFMDGFLQEVPCVVAGSTWAEDESVLVPFINASESPTKFIIAPHNIKPAAIKKLTVSLKKKTICFSSLEGATIPMGTEVLILDTIGLLTKIYSYADIAYVGGGFATGLHNTLEPAVYGIPVLIGPNYKNFKEATDLVAAGGILSINSKAQFEEKLNSLLHSELERKDIGRINRYYVERHQGATDKIFDHIKMLL